MRQIDITRRITNKLDDIELLLDTNNTTLTRQEWVRDQGINIIEELYNYIDKMRKMLA